MCTATHHMLTTPGYYIFLSMSPSGYYIFLGNDQGAVFGKNFAPKTPSLSSTEAEYVCASEAWRQGVWVKMFLQELGFFNGFVSKSWKIPSRASTHCARLFLIRVFATCAFTITTSGTFIIRDRFCAIVKIGTGDQTADLATKLLPASATLKHSKAVLGLR